MEYINIKVPIFFAKEATNIEHGFCDLPIIIKEKTNENYMLPEYDEIVVGKMNDSFNGEMFGRFFRTSVEYIVEEFDSETNEIKKIKPTAVYLDIETKRVKELTFKLDNETDIS